MPADPRFENLSARHHHFVQAQDPWHIAVLGRFAWFRQAFTEGRVQQSTGDAGLHGGQVENVWYSVDVDGNLLQEWGFDPPPVFQ